MSFPLFVSIVGSIIGRWRLRDASALPIGGTVRMAPVLSLAGRHVLVVEDEAILALELIEDLEAVGAVPLGPVMTLERALRFIETADRIDAALLNVMLHRRESFPIADELRRRGIPFVFVTGSGETAKARFPGVPVHPKPADVTEIVRTLAVTVSEQTLFR